MIYVDSRFHFGHMCNPLPKKILGAISGFALCVAQFVTTYLPRLQKQPFNSVRESHSAVSIRNNL